MNHDETVNATWVVALIIALAVLSVTLHVLGSYRLSAIVGIAALSVTAGAIVAGRR